MRAGITAHLCQNVIDAPETSTYKVDKAICRRGSAVIDWLSFYVPYDGAPICDQYYVLQSDGSFKRSYVRGVWREGSYSSKCHIEAISLKMRIECNPSKFLTGQNVCGTDDIKFLVNRVTEAAFRALGQEMCPTTRAALDDGDVTLTRVDCTYHYDVGSEADVDAWIRAVGENCYVKYRGRGHFNEGMCATQFGVNSFKEGKVKASRRSTFKFYNKYREIQLRPLECAEPQNRLLSEWVRGKVRAEAVYRSLDLKKFGLHRVRQWKKETSEELHRKWIERMEIAGNVELTDSKEEEMSPALRRTYRLWKYGDDLRLTMQGNQRRTFYRHRKALLEYGIDIAVPAVTECSDVRRRIPVIEVLTAKRCDTQEHELIFRGLLQRAA